MKKFLSVLLASLALATMFSGCSQKNSDTGDNSSGKSKETVTLRIWGGVPPEAGPQASVDLFNKQFKDKGIQAEYERFVNDDTGNMKLETSLLAGSDVDLYMTYTPDLMAKRAKGGMALDLSKYIEKDKFDMEKSFGSMTKSTYIDGKPYSLPTKLDQYGIVINKSMFDAAGITVPTEWTYDEFRDIAKKLTKGEGQNKVYGFFWNSQQDLTYPMSYFAAQTLGGDVYYKNGGKESNFDNPVIKQTLELMNNMMNVDKSSPTHVDSVTQKLSQEGMFITGKAAMTIGPWIVRSLKDTAKYPHDFVTAFAPYPVAEKGQRNYAQGGLGDMLCINPKSKNTDAAWEFAKWYATEGMLPLVSGGRVPSYTGFDSEKVVNTYISGAEKLFDVQSTKDCLITPKKNQAVTSITTKLPEIKKIYTEEVEALLTNKKTIDQCLTDAKKRADEQLAAK